MENKELKEEIDALIRLLGEETAIAKPAVEREVMEKIRAILDSTREERTRSSRDIWEQYLPYAAKRCYQLTKLEEGWEDDLDYFASENAQFWLDSAGAFLEQGEPSASKNALGHIIESTRIMKRDRIAQVDILLQALEYTLELSDKKRSVQLYEEAEKLYGKYLAGGADYTGSGWLPKIKKIGRQVKQYREKLRRYFQYAESIPVSVEAETEGDLVRIIEYLQQNLPGRVAVTRRVKELDPPETPAGGRFRARLKITLD